MTGGGAQRTRRDMRRAVRRLVTLEYLLLIGAGLLSMLGGLIAALLLGEELGFPLRRTWAITSLLLFVLPGVAVLARNRIQGRRPTADPDDHDDSRERVDEHGR